MSELAAWEIPGGVAGAGRDSFQSGSPGGGGAANEFLRGLLGTPHRGGGQGSAADTGEEEVRVVSSGLLGVFTASPFHFFAGSSA